MMDHVPGFIGSIDLVRYECRCIIQLSLGQSYFQYSILHPPTQRFQPYYVSLLMVSCQ